jgi:proteasome assembly chaperone (PAC2) family protein
MNEYAEHVVNLLKKTDQLDFSHAYMPLILGGITVYDSVMTKDEHNVEMLHETRLLLDERGDEQNEDNEPIFEMTKRIIDIALQKYGYIDR